MTPQQRARLRAQKIHDAMLPLVGDTRFRDFMEIIEEQQKAAMIDACNERIVVNERLSLAALGEVRAYEGIISFYKAKVEELQNLEAQAEELRQAQGN